MAPYALLGCGALPVLHRVTGPSNSITCTDCALEVGRLALRSCLSDFTAEHYFKKFGVIGVGKTIQRVPRIVFADRTTFRWNAQVHMELHYSVQHPPAQCLSQHRNLMRIFAIK